MNGKMGSYIRSFFRCAAALVLAAAVAASPLQITALAGSGTQPATEAQTSAAQAAAPQKSAAVRPAVPTVSAVSRRSKVYLKWGAVSGANVYYVYRRNAGTRGYTKIKETTKLKYTDSGVNAGSSYVYKVRAVSTASGLQSKTSKALKILVCAINPNKKMIALTFDDGPGPYTEAIVKCLKKYGMHATFFVVGNRVGMYPNAVRSAFNAGCEIGNHSYDHAYLPNLSYADIKAEIKKTNKNVKAVIGQNPTITRPTYGAVNSSVRKAVGMPLICWSVDTLDWKTRSKSATIKSVMSNARDGAIILMHDIHQPTQQAALALIPKLVKEGYQLVTVSELARYHKVSLKKGYVYYSITK